MMITFSAAFTLGMFISTLYDTVGGDVQCTQCRYVVSGRLLYDTMLNTNLGDLDINCTDQAATVNTVTCNHTCAEAVFHGTIDTSQEPLAIDVYSRGCGGDVIPGCYNINQHDNLVGSALGNLADFLEDTDGAVCFCNDTDGCNNRPSDGIGAVPLVTTPTPTHSKYCKTCVQYKVPSDANMESMLMNNVDSADYACIYRPGLCHRKKCRDENDVCAAIHVILGKEENGVSVPYVEVYRRGCLSDFPDATPGCYNTTRVEDSIKYMLGYPGDTCITYDQGTVCTCTERVCDITSIPGWRPVCITSCKKYKDGDYQYCDRCDHYASCVNGALYDMPCPDGLLWDDITMRCETHSQTCGE